MTKHYELGGVVILATLPYGGDWPIEWDQTICDLVEERMRGTAFEVQGVEDPLVNGLMVFTIRPRKGWGEEALLTDWEAAGRVIQGAIEYVLGNDYAAPGHGTQETC